MPDGKSAEAARLRWRELTSRVQKSRFPNSRPRDAATLIILDRSGAEPKLLMGRRHLDLKFMPGKFVFPGGRVEPRDYLGSVGCRMPAPMAAKLLSRSVKRPHRQRAFALAHAALRETQEETGVIIGTGTNAAGAGAGPRPDFSGVSFLARAITPARVSRRFDTRFFVVAAERITGHAPIVDGEFTAVEWFSLSRAREQDLPSITRIILDDLDERLRAGTLDDPEAAVPFYFLRGACFHRKLL
jgi:8-oxo-dGTP pyrophosphatase MutT (NUDIX family)